MIEVERRSRLYLALLVLGLVALALRLPGLPVPLWNVDEAVSAVVANSLLDGGVVYRDAVDHRGPVTYFVYAAVFALFGRNDMLAIHAALVVLAAALAAGVVALGRLAGLGRAAVVAGMLFLALSAYGFHPRDVAAFHTEWLAAAFSTAAACLFLLGVRRGGRPPMCFAAGVLFALAAWTKQPAALDLAAAGLVLASAVLPAGQGTRPLGARAVIAAGGALALGFAAVSASFLLYFARAGAWDEFTFYFWTYNRRYYLAAVSPGQWVAGLLRGFELAARPLGLGALATAGGALVAHEVFGRIRALRGRAGRAPSSDAPAAGAGPGQARLYVLIWAVCAFVGASLSARAFGHYFIQLLPSWCLLAAVALDALAGQLRRRAPGLASVGPALALGCVLAPGAVPLVNNALALRSKLGAPEAVDSVRERAGGPASHSLTALAAHIRVNAGARESIFVWGFMPELYVLANRPAATRFPSCQIMVGLIPWMTAPDADTSAWEVPGSMDVLLRELAHNRPRFIVDTAPADLRGFGNYPPEKYPHLARFINAGYELDPSFAGNRTKGTLRLYRRVPSP
jgi:4-amino-4-deoxy-L-arabinose transferase-like glycosyltransferase